MEALGILMVPVLILLLVLAVLAFLLPYFVYAIANRILKLVTQGQEQTKALNQLLRHIESGAQLIEGQDEGLAFGVQDAATAKQLETNNQLLRQLLRAYGHEPEA